MPDPSVEEASGKVHGLIERSRDLIRERSAYPPLEFDELERIRATLAKPTFLSLNAYDAWKLLREIDRLNSIGILKP